jgi:hypothetical protein
MYLGQRIERYVRRYFLKHITDSYYPFPTVKQVARGLKVSIKECVDEIEGCGSPLMLTAYYTRIPEPLSAHFVEICE